MFIPMVLIFITGLVLVFKSVKKIKTSRKHILIFALGLILVGAAVIMALPR